jgi:hypothetical protein
MCVRISSVRRVLQFTPHNAVSCVLHRSAIRVIHRLQSYRLFIELTSATILDFKGSRDPRPKSREARSPNSCDSANAYTSLAPATEVEGTPRTDTDKLQQQPRTRHRTKLGTQWDRSGLRPTWGHFLSRSVETPESVITTIAFQQGGTAKNELHCQYRKTDRLGSQRPSNPGHPREPTFLRHYPETSLHVRFSLVSVV